MKQVISFAMAAIVMVSMSLSASAQKGAKVEKVMYKLEDSCPDCIKKIEKTIPFEKGVKDLSLDTKAATATVTFDPSKTNKETITKAFEKLKIGVKEVKACCKDASKPCTCEDGKCKDGGCCKDGKAETKGNHSKDGDCCGHDHGKK